MCVRPLARLLRGRCAAPLPSLHGRTELDLETGRRHQFRDGLAGKAPVTHDQFGWQAAARTGELLLAVVAPS